MAIEAFTIISLSEDVALVTYRSVARAPGAAAQSAWRSSIWVRHEGRWRLRFHQGTPASAGGPDGA